MISSFSSVAVQRIAVSLSREELYIVMRLIKATQLPGFDPEWLNMAPDGTLPGEVKLTLDVAAKALMARGYLTQVEAPTEIEPTAYSMPSPVIALVGACAFGEETILLALRTPTGYRQMYLHELRGLGVAHSMPLPDVHQFEALNGREGILGALDDILGLHSQTKPPLPEGKVFMVNMQAARDTAMAGEVNEATSLLVRGGLPATTAQALGEAMREFTALGGITIISRDVNDQRCEAAMAVVVTPDLCFMLSEGGSHPASFHVQPVSAEDLRQWIISCLP